MAGVQKKLKRKNISVIEVHQVILTDVSHFQPSLLLYIHEDLGNYKWYRLSPL